MGTRSAFACFGYGSLVNAQTRRPRESRTIDARLKGWRREWRAVSQISGPGVCALSVRPDGKTEIDGVLVVDAIHRLPGLDKREAQYDRLTLQRGDLRLLRTDPLDPGLHDRLIIYRAERPHRQWGNNRAPVTQSYVDAVMKGFLDRFGLAGLKRFVATTDGWDIVPILQDRARPRYPRAVNLTVAEQELFDQLLDGARKLELR